MREYIKKHKVVLALLAVMAVVLIGFVIYLQPRTIALIEPNKISAYGIIAGIAPGNSFDCYIKANNPYLESNGIQVEYIMPETPYTLTHDPFGTEENKIMPPIIYEPAPQEAATWFTITTDDNQAWGIVNLLPYQSKALPFKIRIPENANLPKHWYFMIENRNAVESGPVVTRNRCICLVDMR